MGIKLEDLPESYRRQAARKILEAEREKRNRRRDCSKRTPQANDRPNQPET